MWPSPFYCTGIWCPLWLRKVIFLPWHFEFRSWSWPDTKCFGTCLLWILVPAWSLQPMGKDRTSPVWVDRELKWLWLLDQRPKSRNKNDQTLFNLCCIPCWGWTWSLQPQTSSWSSRIKLFLSKCKVISGHFQHKWQRIAFVQLLSVCSVWGIWVQFLFQHKGIQTLISEWFNNQQTTGCSGSILGSCS